MDNVQFDEEQKRYEKELQGSTTNPSLWERFGYQKNILLENREALESAIKDSMISTVKKENFSKVFSSIMGAHFLSELPDSESVSKLIDSLGDIISTELMLCRGHAIETVNSNQSMIQIATEMHSHDGGAKDSLNVENAYVRALMVEATTSGDKLIERLPRAESLFISFMALRRILNIINKYEQRKEDLNVNTEEKTDELIESDPVPEELRWLRDAIKEHTKNARDARYEYFRMADNLYELSSYNTYPDGSFENLKCELRVTKHN